MLDNTRKLLEECNSGCKMAVNSMRQVDEFVRDGQLKNVIGKYRESHEELERRSAELLREGDAGEKDPWAAAVAFSWITTEVKLSIQDDNNQIAKLLMDGCNMGIQSIGEACNKYSDASGDAQKLARDLIGVEEAFMKELQRYL